VEDSANWQVQQPETVRFVEEGEGIVFAGAFVKEVSIAEGDQIIHEILSRPDISSIADIEWE
jgi:hypothetical protein